MQYLTTHIRNTDKLGLQCHVYNGEQVVRLLLYLINVLDNASEQPPPLL